MKISQVGVQLYTLRDFLKTPDDIAASLKKVRAIGYEAVQLSGMGPIDEAELVKMLDGEGLVCAATHEGADNILNTPEKVVDRLQKLNCKYTAYPCPSENYYQNKESAMELAKGLDAAGAVLRKAGQVLTYHNHSIEFLRFDGELMLDMIYDNTDAQNLQGEPDTYWIQHGGGNPVAWCEKLAGRLPLLHMKDYKINSERQPAFAEIGYGNLDWKAIIAAAEKSGCEWYLIEQDRCDGNPFDSLKMSFDYIKGNLVD